MQNKIVWAVVSVMLLSACKKDVVNTSNGTGTIISAANVPQAVLSTFTSSFSGATETEWEHNEDNFSCQFNQDDQRHEAVFDDNGHQSAHKIICLEAAVPALILNAFRESYPDIVSEWNFTNEGTWKAHFMRGSVKWEVTFNTAGTVIKAEHE